MQPCRQAVLDDAASVRKQVAWPRLQRREPSRATPDLDDDRPAGEALGDIAAIAYDELEAPSAHTQPPELEQPPNSSRYAHLDRHADSHLYADPCPAGAPGSEEDERRAVAGRELARGRHAQADGCDATREDDHPRLPQRDETRAGG
jgi:hypothetical protein